MSNMLQRYTSFLQQRLDCSTGFLDHLVALDVFSDQQKKSCESFKVSRNYYKQNEKVLRYLNRKAVGQPGCVVTILEALRQCQNHLAKHIENENGLSDEDFDPPLSSKQMKEIEKLSGPLCSSRILQCTDQLLEKCLHKTEPSSKMILNYTQYERIVEEKGVCGRGKLLLDFIKRSSVGGLKQLVELLRGLGQDEAANKLDNIASSYTCQIHISFGLSGRPVASNSEPSYNVQTVTGNNNKTISCYVNCSKSVKQSASLDIGLADKHNSIITGNCGELSVSDNSSELSSPGNFVDNAVTKNCIYNQTDSCCQINNKDFNNSKNSNIFSDFNLDSRKLIVENQLVGNGNSAVSNANNLQESKVESDGEITTETVSRNDTVDPKIRVFETVICDALRSFKEVTCSGKMKSVDIRNVLKGGELYGLMKDFIQFIDAEVGHSIVLSLYCTDASALEKLLELYDSKKLQESISDFLNTEFISKSDIYNDLIIEKVEIYDCDLEDMRKFCRDAKKKSLSPGEPRMLRKRRQTSTDSPETDMAQASVWDPEGVGFTKRRARVSSSMSPSSSSSSSSSSAHSCNEKSGLLTAFLHSMSTLSCSYLSGITITSLPSHIQEQILHKAAVSHISELAIVSLSSCFTAYVKLALVCQVWRTRLRSKSCRVRLKKLLIEFCHQHDIEDPSILRLSRNYVHISIANLPNHIQERMLHKAAAILQFRQSAISSASSANAYMRLSCVRPAWRTILHSERFKMRLKRLLKDDSLFKSFRACPRQEMALELPVRREGGVKGLTRLDQYYYALVNRFNKVFQFSCDKPYELIKSIEISELKFPTDIAACSKTHRLYIGDSDSDCIWIVDSKIFKTCGKIENVKWPSQLSVTSDGRVLTVDDFDVLKMFSSDGTVVPFADRSTSKRLPPEVDHPWHVVEKTNGNFLVCYGENEFSDGGVIELSPTLETVAKFNFSQVSDLVFNLLPTSRNTEISCAGNTQSKVEKPGVEIGGEFSTRGVSQIGVAGSSGDALHEKAGMHLAKDLGSVEKPTLEKPFDGNLTAEKPTDGKSVIDEKPSLEVPVSIVYSSDSGLTKSSYSGTVFSNTMSPSTSDNMYPSIPGIMQSGTICHAITTVPQFFTPMLQPSDLTYQSIYQSSNYELESSLSSTLGTSLCTLGTSLNTGTESGTLSSIGNIASTIVPQHEIHGPIVGAQNIIPGPIEAQQTISSPTLAQLTIPGPMGIQQTICVPIISQQQSHQLSHFLPIYASNVPSMSQQQQQPTYPLPNLQQSTYPLPGLRQPTYPLPGLQQPTYPLPGLQQPTYPLPGLQQTTYPLPNLQQPTYPLPGLQQLTYPLLNLQQPTYPLPGLQQPTYPLPGLQQPTYPLPNLQQPTYPLPGLQLPTYPLPGLQQPTYPLPNLQQPCLPIFSAYSACQSQLAACSNLRTQPCPSSLSPVQCPRFQNPETSSQTNRARPSSDVSVSLRSPRAISLCPFDEDAFFVCDPMIGRVLLVSSDLGRARVVLDRDNGCPEKPFRIFFDVETRKLLVGDKELSNVHVFSV